MKQQQIMGKVLILALSLIVLVVSCADPTEGKPKATVGEAVEIEKGPSGEAQTTEEGSSTQPSASEGAQSGTLEGEGQAQGAGGEDSNPVQSVIYKLDPDCYIGFASSKVTGTHYGQFSGFDGTIKVPDNDPSRMDIDVTIDTSTVDTDNRILTSIVKGDEFFDIEKYPTMRFVSTSVKKTSSGYDITGNFTLRGITKSITFPATVEIEGDQLKGFAEFSINRKDWGIVYKGVGDNVIREDVLLTLDVIAKAQ